MPNSLQDSIPNKFRKFFGRTRRLLDVNRARGTDNSIFLNGVLREIGDPNYLEIGLSAGLTFEAISARRKVGVDPKIGFRFADVDPSIEVHQCASDEFFSRWPKDSLFDVIFLDGLHEAAQTYRDILNSLGTLSKGGLIVVDDTIPKDWVSAIPSQARSLETRKYEGLDGVHWHGDVWRAVEALSRPPYPRFISWGTAVDQPNPKTLIWCQPDCELSLGNLEMDLTDMSYDEVFGTEIPSWLQPSSSEDLLSSWLKSRSCDHSLDDSL